MTLRVLIFGCVIFSAACGQPRALPHDRVLALAELNSASLAALDPARTAFILNSAPLEAHGPHIPIGSDIYQGDYSARRTAEQLADSLPDWSIVLMPTLWYGIDGANLIPERTDIRGTISLHPSTLRALAADLGSQLADQGFRWLFLVHIHGAALEHVALSDAADFVRETRGMGMFNIGSLGYTDSEPGLDSAFAARYSPSERARIGFDVHAGTSETSNMLAVRTDLVSPSLRSMPDVTVHDWEDLDRVGRRPDWQGYWSAPALADSAMGQRTLDAWAARWTRSALRALRGEDVSKLPRYPDGQPLNANMRLAVQSVSRQRAFDAKLASWIANRNSMIDR